MKEGRVLYKNLSYQVVGVLLEVCNELGYGYKEKYYEKQLLSILIKRKLNLGGQAAYKILLKVS
jgi:hypothetical protein